MPTIKTVPKTRPTRTPAEPTAEWARRRIDAWAKHNLRDFPWRRRPRPYDVLIAELLLHRTRADLVPGFFQRFIAAYPNPQALAEARPHAVEELLRPLGFAHRARRLPELGRMLMERHGGRIPDNRAELLALPGVGPYIANAVLAVGFERRVPLVDPNVIHVVTRVFGFRSERSRPRDDPVVWAFVETLLPRNRSAQFALALVDLGAVVCRARRPRCSDCPLSTRCCALHAGIVIPQDRTRKP